jgi:hypothetical protein
LLLLHRAEIRSTACVIEQAQKEVAVAAYFPRAAIGEIEVHRVRKHSGFERPDAFF